MGTEPFDEQGEDLDERGLGSSPTAANPLSPDAGLSSAEDATAAPEPGPAERDVARRRREEAEAEPEGEVGGPVA